MASEMIERVAIALFERDKTTMPRPAVDLIFGRPPVTWENTGEGAKDMYREEARAALEAMRTLSADQFCAGHAVIEDVAPDVSPAMRDTLISRMHRAMLTKALGS